MATTPNNHFNIYADIKQLPKKTSWKPCRGETFQVCKKIVDVIQSKYLTETGRIPSDTLNKKYPRGALLQLYDVMARTPLLKMTIFGVRKVSKWFYADEYKLIWL